MKAISAQKVFFPAACFYSAVAVVLSVIAQNTGWPQGIIGINHGHEMLYGFVLALIAGYNLGKISPAKLWLLFGLWLMARIGFLVAPDSLLLHGLSPTFAIVLAWNMVPRFFAAKKWRNKMISPLLLVICIFPLLWLLQVQGYIALNHQDLLSSFLLLLILLMAFFGGRLIAPTAAGEFHKKGKLLKARVQPRLEGLLLLLLPVGALSISIPSIDKLAGVVTFLSACVLLIRLARWQLWHCSERPDLLGAGIGYLWLTLGTFALSFALWLKLPVQTILHILTIGATGCLSASVMLKSQYKRNVPKSVPPLMSLGIILSLSLAAIFRILASVSNDALILGLSAALWAIAFLRLGFFLVKNYLAASTLSSWRQAT